MWILVLPAIKPCQVVTAMLSFRFSTFDRRSERIRRMLHEHKLLSSQFCVNLFQLNLVLHSLVFQRLYQSADFCFSDRHSPLSHHTLLTCIRHIKKWGKEQLGLNLNLLSEHLVFYQIKYLGATQLLYHPPNGSGGVCWLVIVSWSDQVMTQLSLCAFLKLRLCQWHF